MLGVELVRNAGRIVKAFRFDQNDLQLGRRVDVHDLIAVLFDLLLLGILLRSCSPLPAGENILFSVIYIGICIGVDTELASQTVKHGHGRKTPLIRKRRLRQRVITAIYIKYYLLFWQSCQYKRRIFVTIVCHPPNLCPAR